MSNVQVYCEELDCQLMHYKTKPIVISVGFLIRCEHCGTTMTPHRYKQLINKELRKNGKVS